MTAIKSEVQRFQLHPAILFDIINSQAGSPEKAVMEAVMNAIDAGASRCDIQITRAGFTIVDDGKGFGVGDEGRKAIDDFFKTFGTPHTEGDAKYGRFRMGRGQLMAFGVNEWRTGTFRMSVDIKNKGADYILESDLEPVLGCTIVEQFYDELSPSQMGTMLRELAKMTAFSEIPVSINSEVVSKPPSAMKWDLETDDAYFKFQKIGALSVYNLGMLVMEKRNSIHATGGIIVSKSRLNVNFARNDILVAKCAVWRRISKVLDKHAGVEVTKKKTLTDDDRQYIADQMLAGEYRTHQAARVITDVAGRHHTISSFIHNRTPGVTVAPVLHDSKGERIHATQSAFVLAPETLDRFGCKNIKELKKKLDTLSPYGADFAILEYRELAAMHTDDFRVLTDKELTKSESIAIRALNAARRNFWVAYQCACQDNHYSYVPNYEGWRDFQVGESDIAEAWTDGANTITIRRDLLSSIHQGLDAVLKVWLTILHEACHDAASVGTHEHDLEFYERFHTVSLAEQMRLGQLAALTIDQLARISRQENKKVNQKLMAAATVAGAPELEAELVGATQLNPEQRKRLDIEQPLAMAA